MESLENGLFAKNVAPDFVSLPIYPLGKRVSRRSGSFPVFDSLCVSSTMATAAKAALSQKSRPLSDYSPLDALEGSPKLMDFYPQAGSKASGSFAFALELPGGNISQPSP